MDAFFANPVQLWWLLLALPLIALYMLRHRPLPQRVPSTLFWRSVTQMQLAGAPLSRLRRSASLMLNLAVLLSAVAALAGARIPGGRERGLPVVIVIDRTAGMAARIGEGTRLDLARAQARYVVHAAGDTTFTLLGWDGALAPLAPRDCDDEAALRALRQLDASSRGADTAALVDELRRLQDAQADSRIVLVSDRRPRDLGSRVLFVGAGPPAVNAGIVAAGVSESTARDAEIFCAIALAGHDAMDADVVLERLLAGGELVPVEVRAVRLAAADRTALAFRVAGEGLYRVRLRVEDALALDDFAFVRVTRRDPMAVHFAGEPPPELVRLVDALGLKRGDGPDAAWIITAPATPPPRLPGAYIYPAAPPGAGFGARADLSAVAARPAPGFLWRGAGLPDIRLPQVGMVQSPRISHSVLDAGDGSAIALVAREEGPVSDLVLGFELDRSGGYFAESAAFVVFWANWFEHVSAWREPLPRGALSVADGVRVPALSGRREFRYVLRMTPAGERVDDMPELVGRPGEVLETTEPGVYRFEDMAETRVPLVGISLLNAGETDTAPPSAEATGTGEIASRLNALAAGGKPLRADIELTPWLALIAMACLLAEWVLFRRRFPRKPLELPAAGVATVRRKQTGRV